MDLLSDTLYINTRKAGHFHYERNFTTQYRNAAGHRPVHWRRAGVRGPDRPRTCGRDGRSGFPARLGIYDPPDSSPCSFDGSSLCTVSECGRRLPLRHAGFWPQGRSAGRLVLPDVGADWRSRRRINRCRLHDRSYGLGGQRQNRHGCSHAGNWSGYELDWNAGSREGTDSCGNRHRRRIGILLRRRASPDGKCALHAVRTARLDERWPGSGNIILVFYRLGSRVPPV
ncbi:hypothetical protein D3C73_929360 [compost metagenome]